MVAEEMVGTTKEAVVGAGPTDVVTDKADSPPGVALNQQSAGMEAFTLGLCNTYLLMDISLHILLWLHGLPI